MHIGEMTFSREELAGGSTREQDLFRFSYNWIYGDPWFLLFLPEAVQALS